MDPFHLAGGKDPDPPLCGIRRDLLYRVWMRPEGIPPVDKGDIPCRIEEVHCPVEGRIPSACNHNILSLKESLFPDYIMDTLSFKLSHLRDGESTRLKRTKTGCNNDCL